MASSEPSPANGSNQSRSDEELMLELARGSHEALGPLYTRYARLVYHLAAQSLDRAAAEELVQEVFLTIWRGAANFEADQGAFRPWLLRLSHWKILNELRRRRRRPAETFDDDGEEAPLQRVADAAPGPEERAWQTQDEEIVRAALDALPPKQRQAVALAFVDELTHAQVAQTLDVPLGTAKTRIRSGLQTMRLRLAPIAASLLALGLAVGGVRYWDTQQALQRDERALSLVTTSELVPLRLTPASSAVPAAAHANYRSRAGTGLAVLTTEALPPAPSGRTYVAWLGQGERWLSLGALQPGADGSTRLIVERPELATPPQAVEITLEATPSSTMPSNEVVLHWPPPA
jgi:RNA polymerase sigma-70 factor (ECF subfamily)